MKYFDYVPGLSICLALALFGIILGSFIPGIGTVTIALLLGIVFGNILNVKKSLKSGIDFADKKLLPFTIALLGIELKSSTLFELGLPTIFFVILMIVITISAGLLFGKLLGLSPKGRVLLGCGNAICGSSAIASVTKVIDGSEEETGLSIAAVNFMGTIGIFLLPFICKIFGFNEIISGDIIGGVLQAVGQVVAAGFSMSDNIGNIAVLIKMSRVLMLGPVILILGFYFGRTQHSEKPKGGKSFPVPLFIVGFFLMFLLSSSGMLTTNIESGIASIAHFLLAIAMAGIGVKINFGSLRKNGPKLIMVETMIMFVQVLSASLMANFLA